MAKIHKTRRKEKTHVEIIITNAQGNKEILSKLKKALIKMRRLWPVSYTIIEVDFPE